MIHRFPPTPPADRHSADLSRAERSAAARRARARRHYDQARSKPAQRSRRVGFAVLGTVAVALGVAASGPLGTRLADRWLAGEPLAAVRVVGNQRVATQALLDASGLRDVPDAGSLRPASVSAALEQHPWIGRARVTRLPTREVVMAVAERVPRALVRPAAARSRTARPATAHQPEEQGAAWTLVDAAAEPIEAADPAAWPDLPRVTRTRSASAPASLAQALALAARLPATGLAGPGALEIAWDEDGDAGWVVRCDAPASPEAPPLDLWLGDATDEVLTRLTEMLASAPVLHSLASIGDADHNAAASAASPLPGAQPEESDAIPQKKRVRVDLRFEGRAIFSQSDPQSPADA